MGYCIRVARNENQRKWRNKTLMHWLVFLAAGATFYTILPQKGFSNPDLPTLDLCELSGSVGWTKSRKNASTFGKNLTWSNPTHSHFQQSLFSQVQMGLIATKDSQISVVDKNSEIPEFTLKESFTWKGVKKNKSHPGISSSKCNFPHLFMCLTYKLFYHMFMGISL